MSFWSAVVETNTFNFVILLLIFAILYKKLNVSDMLEKMKKSIITAIEIAKAEKSDAENKLNDAQKTVKNLDNELKERAKDAELKANAISEKIISDCNDKVKSLQENAQGIIFAEEKTISAKAQNDTLKSATELAKRNIIERLSNDRGLHDRLIEESIGEL